MEVQPCVLASEAILACIVEVTYPLDTLRRRHRCKAGAANSFVPLIHLQMIPGQEATRLEAIATRVEGIASRLEAIATRLEGIASRLEAITTS